MNHAKNLDKRFLILGDRTQIENYSSNELIKKIISRDTKNKLQGVWGTLGWKNDKNFDLDVQSSRIGNTNEDKRDQLTIGLVDELKTINSAIKDQRTDVLERYINFDLADFGINWRSIKHVDKFPELRLDLFVDNLEGAMVYYYHQEKTNYGVLNDEDVDEEYILCRKTDAKFTTKRDRLTYIFDVLPKFDYNIKPNGKIEWLKSERSTTFVVKIVTFKRQGGDNKSILKSYFGNEQIVITDSINKEKLTYRLFGKQKNALLLYDHSVKVASVGTSKKNRFDMRGIFRKVSEDQIDRSKKTLFLVHGTFSNTLNSFEGILKYEDGSSVLQDFLDKSDYTQVVGFNHPTISADAATNMVDLKKMLGNNKFAQPIGIIAGSRGCIVAQAMGGTVGLPFIVGSCLMFSSSNGVGYFSIVKKSKLGMGLKIFKGILKGSPALYPFALVQFSVEYFLKQPGCRQLTFGSNRLKRILAMDPTNSKAKYIAVVNDWDRNLIKNRALEELGLKGKSRLSRKEKKAVRKYLRKRGLFFKSIADFAVRAILGRQHDFVVGVKGQTSLPAKFKVKQIKMNSAHGKYLDPGHMRYRNGRSVDLVAFISKYVN